MEKESLGLYRRLKKINKVYLIANEILCCGSIDNYIENPSEEEYQIISDACCEAYFLSEDCDINRMADYISKQYAAGNMSLAGIKKLTPHQILDMVDY